MEIVVLKILYYHLLYSLDEGYALCTNFDTWLIQNSKSPMHYSFFIQIYLKFFLHKLESLLTVISPLPIDM